MNFRMRWNELCAFAASDVSSSRAEIARSAMRCIDLTSLRGDETPEDLNRLCQEAIAADVAAVCVYARHIAHVAQALQGTSIFCASVAMGFPDARGTLHARRNEVLEAISSGAHEIDMVVTTALIEEQNWDALRTEIRVARDACSTQTLKVILETGALSSVERIYESARIALDEGADFLKTSTGKTSTGATIEAAAALLLALDDHGAPRGLKLSGGLRTLDDYLPYHQMICAHWGAEALRPSRVRIGASSLLAALKHEGTSKSINT